MKNNFRVAMLVCCLAAANGALAGGAMTGGANIYMQIAQNMNLISSYQQQTMTQISEAQQVQMQIRNLTNNPLPIQTPDVQRLATQTGQLISMGAEVSNSASSIDQNLSQILGTGTAAGNASLSYSNRFQGINNTVQGVLRTSLLNAGLNRQNFPNDMQAVQALATKVSASDGNVAAVKTLGEVNTAQLAESIKLRDLLSTQAQAESVYMAGQTQKATDAGNIKYGVMGSGNTPRPTPGNNVGGL
ncbi:conserved exported hypothetical protein [mine drainage metagenome]|uniref:Conjugal transfer protein TrbJ n=1 Tax=mine drainage metagenome TaxID=410659 RepID=A0A3P3ZQ99_9ZZZZ